MKEQSNRLSRVYTEDLGTYTQSETQAIRKEYRARDPVKMARTKLNAFYYCCYCFFFTISYVIEQNIWRTSGYDTNVYIYVLRYDGTANAFGEKKNSSSKISDVYPYKIASKNVRTQLINHRVNCVLAFYERQ